MAAKKKVQLVNEEDILNPDFRKALLEELTDSPNLLRKHEAYKRHEQYKDRTYFYVVDLLLKQFLPETVAEMQYALSNISITRKVINKLAKVYNKGAIRTVKGEKPKDDGTPGEQAKKIEELAKYLKLNDAMKKTNRYKKLHKNALLYVKPKPYQDKWTLALQVLAPYLYDVIPDPKDPECPLVVILSHYTPERKRYYDLPNNPSEVNAPDPKEKAPRGGGAKASKLPIGSKADDDDIGKDGQFIWWSPKFHFTTNGKGEMLPVEGNNGTNPIQKLPFVNFADDQDGQFWAVGGEDLVEMATKLNALLTHLNHVAVTQGYGQLAMTGKNLPKSLQLGPNHAIQIETTDGDPTPTISYLSANPPVEAIMRIIEAQFGLLLSTNNLSTSGFATSLQSPAQFASGIAMLLDKSESIEDTEEQAQAFVDGEPKVWSLIGAWGEVMGRSESLVEDLREYKLDPKTTVVTAFPDVQPIQSEGEHLENLKKRKDLGLNTRVELIMKDNPGMTKEEAAKKLEEIDAESSARQKEVMGQDPNNPNDPSGGNPADKNKLGNELPNKLGKDKDGKPEA